VVVGIATVTLRPLLTRLLVVLLLMQWGTAFAHCLRLAGGAPGLTIEICSPDGLRHVTIPADDGDDGKPALAAPLCPACLGPAAVALPAPEVTIAPPVLLAQATETPAPPPSAPLPLPPRSCQPRAPPTS
jgi:hypothetical protein